jgi:hypothetical protein
MVMYKQNRGLVAGGTIGPQSTGPMMAPKKKPQYSVQSVSGGTAAPKAYIPGYTYQMNPVEEQISRFTNWLSGGENARLQAERAKALTQKAPPMPSAPMMAAPARQTVLSSDQVKELIDGGYIFQERGMTNEGMLRVYNKMMADRGASSPQQTPAQARAEAASEARFITPDFRLPTRSPVSGLINPYSKEYGEGLMTRASARMAKQFAPGRERLQQDLAMRGISPDSPLFQSLMAQSAEREQVASGEAIDRAMMEGTKLAADWEQWKAREEADWLRSGADYARQLATQPADVRIRNAQADAEEARTLIATNPGVIESEITQRVSRGQIDAADAEAALRMLAETDPSQWWNHPAWKIVSAILPSIAGIGLAYQGGAMSRPQLPAARPPVYTGGGFA